MKTLLLFTNEFPFGKRETFLESEIKVLSGKFDRIILIPSLSNNISRDVPENVEINSHFINSRAKIFALIILTLFSPYTYKTILKYASFFLSFDNIILLTKYIIKFNLCYFYAPSLLKKYPGAIIYSYWYSPLVDAFVFLKNTYNFILITRVHRGDLYEEYHKLGIFPYRKDTISKVDKIFSVSYDGIIHLKKLYNVDNVELARLGTFFRKKEINSKRIADLEVVSVSNLIPIKRVELIAKSLILFSRANSHMTIRWNHFGSGYEYLKIINIMVKDCPINFKYYLNGTVSNVDVLNYYSANKVDLFINLSDSEGIPVSMMEAISFGIPILATNVGGVSEIVNNISGILLDPSPSPNTVSDSICKFLNLQIESNLIIEFWNDTYNAEINYDNFSNNILKFI